jgi:hypothetical protein
MMTTTRKDGLANIKSRLGCLPSGPIATSKYYPTEESWVKAPAWWFDVPLDKLKDPKERLHLLCQKIHGGGFDYLSIPISFIQKNVKALKIVERKGKERIYCGSIFQLRKTIDISTFEVRVNWIFQAG